MYDESPLFVCTTYTGSKQNAKVLWPSTMRNPPEQVEPSTKQAASVRGIAKTRKRLGTTDDHTHTNHKHQRFITTRASSCCFTATAIAIAATPRQDHDPPHPSTTTTTTTDTSHPLRQHHRHPTHQAKVANPPADNVRSRRSTPKLLAKPRAEITYLHP